MVHGLLDVSDNHTCKSGAACWYPDAGWLAKDRALAGHLVDQGRSLWLVPTLGEDFRLDDGRIELGNQPRDLDEANLIGSRMQGSADHLPIIDLDVDHEYVPSSTEGHGHLYIRPEHPVPWIKYERVLRAMADAGMIGWAEYVRAVDREGTFVRKPGKARLGARHERMPATQFFLVFMKLWWRALRLEIGRERAARRAVGEDR